MEGFVAGALDGLADLRGFVLMAKSPSCGMERIRVYREDGEVGRRDASGLFAGALMERYPLMPVEEEGRLNDDRLRENFVERVFIYDDWCRLREAGLTPGGLIEFHSRHKFQLLAHCEATYRRLGPMLADLKTGPWTRSPTITSPLSCRPWPSASAPAPTSTPCCIWWASCATSWSRRISP